MGSIIQPAAFAFSIDALSRQSRKRQYSIYLACTSASTKPAEEARKRIIDTECLARHDMRFVGRASTLVMVELPND